jgi:hypothetical protein
MVTAAVLTDRAVELEHRLWRAAMDQDIEFYRDTLTDDCVLIWDTGPLDKLTALQMMSNDRGQILCYHMEEPLVRELGCDVVLVSYQANYDETSDGETLRTDVYVSTIHVLRNEHWHVAFHQQTPVLQAQ